MRTKRNYSDHDKGSALAFLEANAGNISFTSRETKIPASTLRQWRDGKGVSESVLENRDVKKEELADLFERVARLYVGQALKTTVAAKAAGKDAIIAAATAIDKMRLLRDQPTSITANAAEIAERLSTTLSQARERKLTLVK